MCEVSYKGLLAIHRALIDTGKIEKDKSNSMKKDAVCQRIIQAVDSGKTPKAKPKAVVVKKSVRVVKQRTPTPPSPKQPTPKSPSPKSQGSIPPMHQYDELDQVPYYVTEFVPHFTDTEHEIINGYREDRLEVMADLFNSQLREFLKNYPAGKLDNPKYVLIGTGYTDQIQKKNLTGRHKNVLAIYPTCEEEDDDVKPMWHKDAKAVAICSKLWAGIRCGSFLLGNTTSYEAIKAVDKVCQPHFCGFCESSSVDSMSWYDVDGVIIACMNVNTESG